MSSLAQLINIHDKNWIASTYVWNDIWWFINISNWLRGNIKYYLADFVHKDKGKNDGVDEEILEHEG